MRDKSIAPHPMVYVTSGTNSMAVSRSLFLIVQALTPSSANAGTFTIHVLRVFIPPDKFMSWVYLLRWIDRRSAALFNYQSSCPPDYPPLTMRFG